VEGIEEVDADRAALEAAVVWSEKRKALMDDTACRASSGDA
jgi:hypothetical protein